MHSWSLPVNKISRLKIQDGCCLQNQRYLENCLKFGMVMHISFLDFIVTLNSNIPKYEMADCQHLENCKIM